MSGTEVYPASPIKRLRATKDQMQARREALHAIIAEMHPMTVRQVFYQATVHGIVEKTEGGYAKVQTDLVQMRRAKMLPYGWLADNTRWQRKPRTYGSIQEALEETAQFYRKSLWRGAACRVEVWLEKDALSGVVFPVTQEYDVPLMVTRGYASLSFLHSAAEEITEAELPTYIYHLGDHDPSGVNAGEKIEQTLREQAPAAEIHFERIAVTRQQIEELNLPSRPTKVTDSRAKNFEGESVELDAIPPSLLRAMVLNRIERHLPQEELKVLKVAEASERDFLRSWVGQIPDADGVPGWAL